MKVIDTFFKLTLPDLTISPQNMYKGGRCQAPNNMILKLSSELNLSKKMTIDDCQCNLITFLKKRHQLL